MDQAEKMFDGLQEGQDGSHNASTGAYLERQLHKDFGVKSEKIFIFYTRKYRSYDRSWKWWFHVAPMVRVKGQEVVLDTEFAKGPLTEYDWEKKFNRALEK